MASNYSDWIAAAAEQEKELTDKIGNIVHYLIQCKSKDDKDEAVATIHGLNINARTLVFCQTTDTAKQLVAKLTENGHDGVVYVEPEVNRGTDNAQFLDSKTLVTTARLREGASVGQVAVVINYDLPSLTDREEADCGAFIRRIEYLGSGKCGRAINLIEDKDPGSMETIVEICQRMKILVLPMDINDIIQALRVVA